MANKQRPKRPQGRTTPGKGGATRAPAPKGGPTPKASQNAPARAAGRARAAAEARNREDRRKRIIAAVVVVAVIAMIAIAVGIGTLGGKDSGNGGGDKAKPAGTASAVTCTRDTNADQITIGNGHIPDPQYSVNPPAGGNHLPTPAPPDFFTPDNAPPDGNVVHSMEHGYVIVWYRPDLAAADLDKVRSVFETAPKDVLAVPRAGLPAGTTVAATAWGHRTLCDGVDPAQLNQFVVDFANKGPEKVPH